MKIIKDRFPEHVSGMVLNNGAIMPQIGLGVFEIKEGKPTYDAVLTALKDGYRHIDTAHAYQNERSVGRAMRDSGIPREEIWITSKLWPNEYGPEETSAALERMMKRLDVDYIDMVYLHQPVGDYVGAYKALEEALKAGKIKAIGISNFDFSDELYHSLVDNVDLIPDCFQMECHPFAQRLHWMDVLKRSGIVLEAWYPLGGRGGSNSVFTNAVLKEIAEKHKKSVVQVILRWHIQEGHSVLPGSENPEHIKENLRVFDFELSDEEMAAIRAINEERRSFNETYENICKMFTSWKIYD